MNQKIDTRMAVPIHKHKKDTGFHICYEVNDQLHSLIIACYGTKGDFFFYPNMQNYTVSLEDYKQENTKIEPIIEKEHKRITFHESGTVVGPDKAGRPVSLRYDKLNKSIKDSPDGVHLCSHFLAGPNLYKKLTAKRKKRGDWFAINVINDNRQPLIAIDAFPIFKGTDISKITVKKDYICGFETKEFEDGYKVLILFERIEIPIEEDTELSTHTVKIPINNTAAPEAAL